VSDQIASCDTEAERETRSLLLHPFVPIVCIADEKETIRYDVQSVAFYQSHCSLG
jgi:regulator-associated protein of mTOR